MATGRAATSCRRRRAPADQAPHALPAIAIGLNWPGSWGGHAFAASASVGVAVHHALRLNIAHHDNSWSNSFQSAVADIVCCSGDAPLDQQTYLDVGLSWVWYPRALWSGAMVELGAMRRSSDLDYEDFYANGPEIRTHSTTYAGRAMIGWSWTIGHHAFISFAEGVSLGHEVGHATVQPCGTLMTTPRATDQARISPEMYLRFGFAYGG